MQLVNEFSVRAPLEQTWATLLDIERVSGCLPGARISAARADGVYPGSMRVKVGPAVVEYEGTAQVVDVDEDEWIASFEARAHEVRGQGTVSALIRNRLRADGDTTHVRVETTLDVTGRQAQFGRGNMQDVAGRMLGDFAQRYEASLADGGETAAPGTAGGTATSAPPSSADDGALDLGSVLTKLPIVRYGVPAVVGLLLALVLVVRRARG
jgi:carbon monoxide dehydrogenase subunit G